MATRITHILEDALSTNDQNKRNVAQQQLKQAEEQNFAQFVVALSTELLDENVRAESRHLAGIILKNSVDFSRKTNSEKTLLIQKWNNTPNEAKAQVKQQVMTAMQSQIFEARRAASQVLAKIGAIEVPQNMWPDLIQTLINGSTQPNPILKQSSFEALGFLLEEIDESLVPNSDVVLTAVVNGMRAPETEVKLAATTALLNAIEHAEPNFKKKEERDFIMTVVCEVCRDAETKLRTIAFECIARIAALYYEFLPEYIQVLFEMTVAVITNDQEAVGLQAVEFWATICDVEIEIREELEDLDEGEQPERPLHRFIDGVAKFLMEVLLQCLTKQQEDQTEGDWNISMAAGSCIRLISQTIKEAVIPFALPFVTQNVQNPDWRYREAAFLAFGSILHGPDTNSAEMKRLVSDALHPCMGALQDQNSMVKDTAAWTVGTICELHRECVMPHLEQVMQLLVTGLQDEEPRVAANVAFALHNLFQDEEEDKQTSPLSRFYPGTLQALMGALERDDVDEGNLQGSLYETIGAMIVWAPHDVFPLLLELLPVLITKFEGTFQAQQTPAAMKETSEIQTHLCATLMSMTTKLDAMICPHADRMMASFIRVLQSPEASIHEEALLAIGALAGVEDVVFEKYMQSLLPFLLVALANKDYPMVCANAVGVVADLSRSLGRKLDDYITDVMNIFVANIQSSDLDRHVKLPILTCFGDIAMAIGGKFEKFIGVVGSILKSATDLIKDVQDDEDEDYVMELRQSICEAWTGIILGTKSKDEDCSQYRAKTVQYLPGVLEFLNSVAVDEDRGDELTKAALAVLADFATMAEAKPVLSPGKQQQWIIALRQECMKIDKAIVEVFDAAWAAL